MVQGTGPENQIRANDVLSYTVVVPSKPQPAPAQSVATNFEDAPINNIRSVIAKRLLQSKQTIPHYYLTVDLEIDNALKSLFHMKIYIFITFI